MALVEQGVMSVCARFAPDLARGVLRRAVGVLGGLAQGPLPRADGWLCTAVQGVVLRGALEGPLAAGGSLDVGDVLAEVVGDHHDVGRHVVSPRG